MRKNKVKRGIIAIALVIVALYFIIGTYARYSTVGTGSAVADVAKWNVSIKNGETELTSTTQDINFTVGSSDYVVSNKIAPSISAYADIDVYLEGTEVAVDLGVAIDTTQLSSVIGANTQFNVSATLDGVSYTSTDSMLVPLPNGSAFNSTNGTKHLRVIITWENSNSNNAADTALGTANAENRHVSIPVTITAQQHIAN